MFKKVLNFLDEVRLEFKKVVWATKKDTISATISVIVFVIIVATILSLIDYLLSMALNAIL